VDSPSRSDSPSHKHDNAGKIPHAHDTADASHVTNTPDTDESSSLWGEELSPDELEQVKKCYAAAMRSLAYGDKSEKQLREKLMAKGFEMRHIGPALYKLKKEKYLCDRRYMEHMTVYLANKKLLGPKRIAADFLHIYFGRESYEAYFNEAFAAASERIDFNQNAVKYIIHHCAGDMRNLIMPYLEIVLGRRGFTREQIEFVYHEFN